MGTSQDVNQAMWDDRAPVHAASLDYAVDALVADPERLSDVVRFDLPRLGRLDGLDVVHLQCHIGTDTLSLARLGARTTTGLDQSGISLQHARALAERAGTPIDYVQSDVAAAVDALGAERFDLLYTGIGALCWLPSVDEWAAVVAGLLRPDGLLVVDHPYFERAEPTVWDEDPETNVQVPAGHTLTVRVCHEWNHGLGQIVTALLAHGLTLTMLVEHDSVPWCALPGQMTGDADGEFRLDAGRERLPMSYTLQAVKAG